jgi:hypothetical protein
MGVCYQSQSELVITTIVANLCLNLVPLFDYYNYDNNRIMQHHPAVALLHQFTQ